MSKKNRDTRPATKPTPKPATKKTSEPPADPNADTKILPAIDGSVAVMVQLPVGPLGEHYVARGFQRDLPPVQAKLCRRVINQLAADGVRLASGRKIERPEDVLCHIMEQIDRQLVDEPASQESDDGTQRNDDRTSSSGTDGNSATGSGNGGIGADGNNTGGNSADGDRGGNDSGGSLSGNSADGSSGNGINASDGNGVPELVGDID